MSSYLTIETIKKILEQRSKNDQFLHLKNIPKPELLKDIEKGTKRIVQAIEQKETITIVGDYDVDGIVSTAIMVEFFESMGIKVNYTIPNRFEHGYGLSPKILEHIDEGLVITVDNGISAFEAGDICQKKGIDLIITDHHTVGEKLPTAYAIINPKQKDCPFPFKEICGAHVAWYLCASLKVALNSGYNLMELLDLLVLAIVADIMPMVCLNKTMSKVGLKQLAKSKRISIKALQQRLGIEFFNEEDIGFKIAPLINCAGRMADPMIALEFLLAKNFHEACGKLEDLIELNELRKKEQLEIFFQAKEQIDHQKEVIVVANNEWNEGIIGIVAAKLCEKYKKPTFVLSINGEIAKASCRSVEEVDLYKLIEKCSSSLLGFGGHKQAAGLSIETKNISLFEKALSQNVGQCKTTLQSDPGMLGKLSIEDVDHEIYDLIEGYRPYGITNPYPLFYFENLQVVEIQKIGKEKQYQKAVVSNGRKNLDLLIFIDVEEICVGEQIHCIAQISKNVFRNQVSYNLLLKELIDT